MIPNNIGPYHVLAKLGEGGMGQVDRARDTRLKRDVAQEMMKRLEAATPWIVRA